MNLIEEIHNQPHGVRVAMYLLSVTAVLGTIGFLWLSAVERNMYFAIHPDPADRQAFLERQEDRTPKPLATIGKAFGSLAASIGTLIGFDSSSGFDRQDKHDTVYLLPLSN